MKVLDIIYIPCYLERRILNRKGETMSAASQANAYIRKLVKRDPCALCERDHGDCQECPNHK